MESTLTKPLTLTQKERMLLEDQKGHEQLCIQKYTNYGNLAKDLQLKQICNANCQVERTHLDSINQLLSGKVPQVGQQQNQSSNQTIGTQGSSVNMNSSQVSGFNLSDADMCQDLLSTEKYVSGTYDTTIFEFRDTQVRDVLNHIQKKNKNMVNQYLNIWKVKDIINLNNFLKFT